MLYILTRVILWYDILDQLFHPLPGSTFTADDDQVFFISPYSNAVHFSNDSVAGATYCNDYTNCVSLTLLSILNWICVAMGWCCHLWFNYIVIIVLFTIWLLIFCASHCSCSHIPIKYVSHQCCWCLVNVETATLFLPRGHIFCWIWADQECTQSQVQVKKCWACSAHVCWSSWGNGEKCYAEATLHIICAWNYTSAEARVHVSILSCAHFKKIIHWYGVIIMYDCFVKG